MSDLILILIFAMAVSFYIGMLSVRVQRYFERKKKERKAELARYGTKGKPKWNE